MFFAHRSHFPKRSLVDEGELDLVRVEFYAVVEDFLHVFGVEIAQANHVHPLVFIEVAKCIEILRVCVIVPMELEQVYLLLLQSAASFADITADRLPSYLEWLEDAIFRGCEESVLEGVLSSKTPVDNLGVSIMICHVKGCEAMIHVAGELLHDFRGWGGTPGWARHLPETREDPGKASRAEEKELPGIRWRRHFQIVVLLVLGVEGCLVHP